MFNHRPGEKVGWQFCKGDFSLILEEGAEQDQQLFNNYSPKGNEDLLTGFGFCIPNNPYDQVPVQVSRSLPPAALHRLHDSMPHHWRSDMGEPRGFLFHLRSASYSGSDTPSVGGSPTMNSLRSTPPELVKSVYIILRETYKASRDTKEAVNEDQIWTTTIAVLLNQMGSALMNITQWERELPDTPPTAGAKAALIYRKGQVKILEETIAELQGLSIINYDASGIGAEVD
ncbi:hypothetical protein F4859DRAFT_527186 [Xylaria cf. heliscus]|nr:hypothetical protein F4859DRAFT_527186 [Xylaria cf. heliscus]